MISKSTWHGLPSWTMRVGSDAITVLAKGGKIASIQLGEMEWLAQPTLPLADSYYGDDFVAGEMCGWDEMFPTITGDRYPDHGEVWAINWVTRDTGNPALEQEVHGRVSPYRLRRTMTMESGRFRIEYEAEATSGAVIPALWAAHPQFIARDARISLPNGPSTVLCVDNPDCLTEVSWPKDRLVDFEGLVGDGLGTKFWLRPESCPELATIHRDERSITMKWDSRLVPYLGIWVDRCAYSREPVVALEPSTGFYDDVDRAASMGRGMTLRAGQPLPWWLEVSWV